MDYTEQHKKRLSYMPWLYFRLKTMHLEWAHPWQNDIQQTLMAMETISIGKNVFIAPEANIFAEPGRAIEIGDNSYIAADVTLHGPVRIGQNVSINHHSTLDGGSAGIDIADHCRIAAYSHLYAFNHGLKAGRLISEQPVKSRGIALERDVWLGSHTGVTDGVTMAEGSVAGMNSVVTCNVPAYTIVAGNPARPIGKREL
ncbi:acyltransferase [Gilvimarinus sp. SDUM040013]|uniref:Acyltransferase n=1 Tax=Gilvimarinus gilvus TaxID=3058038 RepID=A0ABU4RW17_9GAMM|nr:acyltransferase [Gilvimarinus sp. SDUM040013]MDO3386474.1 acyltransferase [Gilvimarinus sp. SDUM040013]MDX6849050.1 acyltransferase [Gilvimarinus sp. SDUM040013]